VPDAMRKKGGASPSSVMGPMLAMAGGGAEHGGVTSLTNEKRSSAYALTPAKVAARQAHLSSAAGQDSHTHNANISRPAARPKHRAKGGVGEVVFGLNPEGCSTDTPQEETVGWGGTAGLSSKALQARTAYTFSLALVYPSTKEYRPHPLLSHIHP